MSKKLLIACYFFPPCPSIGGRRSAKFAKYLAKKGDEIHVIQAINPFSTISPWLKDIEKEINVQRYELPLHYPLEFIVPPKSFLGKLKYRFYSIYFNIFFSRKNKYDYTIFWEKSYLKKAEELIKNHNIKNILISGPPFYYAHQTVKLKDKFPDLNIIVDFRDPWIGSPYYGMSSLKSKQQEYEIHLLNEVYKKSNYFIGPNQFLLKEQKKFVYAYNQNGAELLEVPHAYDRDEVKSFIDAKLVPSTNEKIKLVYGGQLYPGTNDILKSFSSVLDEIRSTQAQLYKRLQIDFYTPETDRENLFVSHKAIVNFHKPIGNDIMSKIAESTFCMIFLAEHNKNFRTTKFLEYSILRKPFIVFGEKGYVAEFVSENKLGRAFDLDTIMELSELLINTDSFNEKEFNRTFDFSEYEFEKVSEGLRKLLI